MKNKTKIITVALIIALYLFSIMAVASAMTISSVDAVNFQLGSEQDITLKVKNTFESDATDVSLILDTSKVPFNVVSSEDNSNEISADDDEKFDFTLKASNDAKAGTYQIPYIISYKMNNASQSKQGTFSLTVEANPELVYSASAENPVVSSQGKIKLKIVNKGFGDAKFTSVKITSDGYTILSEDNQYIGTIASDDSETASFDVIFKKQNPILNAQVEYKDFNNQKMIKNVNIPVTVYSQEQALELGIIKSNQIPMYTGVAVVILVLWFIIRKIRKKRRMNRAQGR